MTIKTLWDSPGSLDRLTKLLIGTAVALIAYGAIHYAIALPALPLREVRINGELTHVDPEQIKEVAQRQLKRNFLTVDLSVSRGIFEKLPWVRTVAARREWPDKLDITIEEHVPLARWGDGALVNTYGQLFSARYEGELPLFTGPEASVGEIAKQHASFQRVLATINQKVIAVHVSPRRAWQIRLDNGLTLELGRDAVESRLQRFVGVYSRTIEPLKRRLEVADLRYSNGFAVRIPELANPPKNRSATVKVIGKNG